MTNPHRLSFLVIEPVENSPSCEGYIVSLSSYKAEFENFSRKLTCFNNHTLCLQKQRPIYYSYASILPLDL